MVRTFDFLSEDPGSIPGVETRSHWRNKFLKKDSIGRYPIGCNPKERTGDVCSPIHPLQQRRRAPRVQEDISHVSKRAHSIAHAKARRVRPHDGFWDLCSQRASNRSWNSRKWSVVLVCWPSDHDEPVSEALRWLAAQRPYHTVETNPHPFTLLQWGLTSIS